MKLSKAQQDVVDRMRAGWTLWRSTSMTYSGRWLRPPDGESGTIDVNKATFDALVDRNVVTRQKCDFPTEQWYLAEGGAS